MSFVSFVVLFSWTGGQDELGEPLAHQLRAFDRHGRGLQVDFVWQDDRFGHQLTLVGTRGRDLILTSVEGLDCERWPASPPIQHVARQAHPGGGAFLAGVGMAGRNHWSLSVESRRESRAIVMDFACRLKEPGEWLGSSYRVAVPTRAADEGTVVISALELSCCIELLTVPRPSSATLQLERDLCRIAARSTSTRWPETVRWRYQVRLCDLPCRA